MKYTEGFINSLFENMLNGFAYHKIVTDPTGKPIDYIFLDVNSAYETITGLKKEDIIGKSILDVAPSISQDSFDWIGFYGEVALENTAPTTEQFSEALDKWLLINAFSPEVGYFVSITIDITDLKQRDINISKKNAQLSQLYQEIVLSEEEVKRHIDALEAIQQTLLENERRADIAQTIGYIGHWDYDFSTGEFWGSEGAFNLFGVERKSHYITNKELVGLILPEEISNVREHFSKLINQGLKYDVEFRIKRQDNGSIRTLHSVAEILTANAESDHKKLIGVIQDITKQVETENILKSKNQELTVLYEEIFETGEELKQQIDELNKHKELLEISEIKYRTLVENSGDAIYSCDLECIFTAVNSRFCEINLLGRDQILGRRINDIFPMSEHRYKEWYLKILTVIHSGVTHIYENKIEYIHNETRYYQITLSPILDTKGEVIGVTGTDHEITSIKEHENKINHMAYHDSLTDLPNRLLFFDRLKNAIDRSKRAKTKIAVLFFDMDNFKRINDTLGHAIGDELLVETGQRIASCMREYDTVARLSGDEFAVLLQNINREEDILSVVLRIQQKFTLPFFLSDSTVDLSTSIGIAVYPENGTTAEELLKNADTAMYKAKDQGRNKYVFFHFTMKQDVIRKVKIEKLIKKAVKYREFILHYQPQYYSDGVTLRGFEALIRWNSSDLGFINPVEFISIAEENGQIIDIGEWVIQEACYMLKRLNDKYGLDLKMSINISSLQLRQRDFEQLVLSYVNYYKVKPCNIELEVTESHFIDYYDVALNVLNKLKNHGFCIALDDFGTGYSSLSYLKKLPIDILKIDQAFVKEIDLNMPENDLTEPIISLVHKLGIETIAEGIETEEQLNYLINAKCDYLQGYYLGMPLNEVDADLLVKNFISVK